MKSKTILIVDDDRAVCTSIALMCKRAGFQSAIVNQPKDILEKIHQVKPHLLLLDMNFTIDTSGRQGLSLLKKVVAYQPQLPVILMTGWATVELAVKGMKIGAKDFVAKPWDNKQLLQSIKTLFELQEMEQPAHEEESYEQFSPIIGQDPEFLKMLELAKRISKTNASVLIEGESGTGKELIAESIHYESKRKDRPFVKVNLGGISSSLFESEMFGHKRGAFTDAYADRIGRFSKADSGTIFLDEIGELPQESQVKLLRVLQEQTFEVLGSSKTQKIDVRVISATNKSLEKMVKEGLFREDLFYRINLIHLKIPPLRERRGDIPLLVHQFVQSLRQFYNRPDLLVTPAALDWIQQQDFPGNIRQLKNLVERTVLLAVKDTLTVEDFSPHLSQNISEKSLTEVPKVGSISLEEMEIQMIQNALAYHQNRVTDAARSLGITRSALYRRLAKYNIPYDS